MIEVKSRVMVKNCMYCEDEFNGRLNQKFCSTKCKNAFHNERNREKESVVNDVNKRLHKNWSILRDLYQVYKSRPIHMQILESNGYLTKYHTHTHNSPLGEKYTMVYDFGFKSHFDNQIQIVKED